MKFEKELKRPDGSRIKIEAHLSLGWMNQNVEWTTTVLKCEPKKRTFKYVVDADSYTYRGMSQEDKLKLRMDTYLQFVTKEEILSVKLELWQSLKPTI